MRSNSNLVRTVVALLPFCAISLSPATVHAAQGFGEGKDGNVVAASEDVPAKLAAACCPRRNITTTPERGRRRRGSANAHALVDTEMEERLLLVGNEEREGKERFYERAVADFDAEVDKQLAQERIWKEFDDKEKDKRDRAAVDKELAQERIRKEITMLPEGELQDIVVLPEGGANDPRREEPVAAPGLVGLSYSPYGNIENFTAFVTMVVLVRVLLHYYEDEWTHYFACATPYTK